MATKSKKKSAKTSKTKAATKKAAPRKRVKVATKSKATKAKSVKANKSAKKGFTFKKFDFAKSWDSIKGFSKKNNKTLEMLGWVLATLVALFLVDMLVQYINNDYSAAVVNNKRISEHKLEKELKSRAGEQILADMITKELVYQEAKKEGVTVTDEDVDAEFDRIAEIYGGLEAFQGALEANNFTVESYKDTLRFEMTIQAMIVEEPTEEELKTFFTENKDTYFSEQENYEDDTANVKDVYTQVTYQSEVTAWMQGLESEATVQNNITDKPNYGFFMATRNIFENIYDSITSNVE